MDLASSTSPLITGVKAGPGIQFNGVSITVNNCLVDEVQSVQREIINIFNGRPLYFVASLESFKIQIPHTLIRLGEVILVELHLQQGTMNDCIVTASGHMSEITSPVSKEFLENVLK